MGQAKRRMFEEMAWTCSECGDDMPCRRDDCPLRERLAEVIAEMENHSRSIRVQLNRIDAIVDVVGHYYKAIKH